MNKKDKLEKKVYESMAEIGKEKSVAAQRMGEEEEKKQISLFYERLEKQKKKEKKHYKKWAAIVAMALLIPSSVYAATHIDSVREAFRNQALRFTSRDLDKIHDEEWAGKNKEKESVYEAFGVKVTVYDCFYDQEDKDCYISYNVDTDENSSAPVDGVFSPYGFTSLVGEKNRILIEIVGVDEDGKVYESYYSGGRLQWYDWDHKRNYMRLDMISPQKENKKITPKIRFQKKSGEEWYKDYEDWTLVDEKIFDMPEGEHLKMKTIRAKEDSTVKLKMSKQSIQFRLNSMESKKWKGYDYKSLQNTDAEVYTEDGEVIHLPSTWGEAGNLERYDEKGTFHGMYKDEYEIECNYMLGGANLSKIKKVVIGPFTFLCQ